MKVLQHRTKNNYNRILLVETDNNEVLGQWPAGGQDMLFYLLGRYNPENISKWAETYPKETDPEAYGELVSERDIVNWPRSTL